MTEFSTEFSGFANIFTVPNYLEFSESERALDSPKLALVPITPVINYSEVSSSLIESDQVRLLSDGTSYYSNDSLSDSLKDPARDLLSDYYRAYLVFAADANQIDFLDPGFRISSSFDSEFGYGLVDAGAAIAIALSLKSPLSDVSDPLINSYGASLVNAPEAWTLGYTGKGVVVAVIDTGIDLNHPDLATSFWQNLNEIPGDGKDNDNNGYVDDINGYDFASRDANPQNSSSREYHGTHVAGIITANRNGTNATDRSNIRYEVTGIAYDAQIMAVRVLNSAGRGTAQSVAQGIRYAADNGAKVINLSLGSPMTSGIEQDALRYAEEKGVVVVSASGNSGYTSVAPDYPARLAATSNFGIAVGAVNRNKQVAGFSNPAGTSVQQYPFVVAPGVSILSTTPNNSFSFLSGTSMATPHVAAVVALMLQANPNLTPAQVKKIISETANPNSLTVA